ncbi:MAG: DMT family transporter [Gemmatimonadota bacterium]|nr:DMT family transporter [Gemmatimonadota bacterium]
MRPSNRAIFGVLALSVIGISFAAPLIRLSHAHAVVIATWRLFFALIIVGIALATTGGWRQWRTLDRTGLLLAAGAGVLLALHFWAWNASIALTTIAASTVLVDLQPVIVAGASAAWLREAPSRRQWIGILFAIVGAAVLGSADWNGSAAHGSNAFLGDVLALGGGVAAALYYLTGRRVRQQLDLWPYVAIVYGVCFLTLLSISITARLPLLHQPPRELAIFAALAIGPMLLGHTGMNWAVKFAPAFIVNLTVLGEPIGATVLGALLPGIRELPSGRTLIGEAIVLIGILVAVTHAAATTGGKAVDESV